MMAIGRFHAGGAVPPAEINMVPLIDVMLVLLVIFMVAAPLMTHAVKLDLPQASSAPAPVAEKVVLSVDAASQWYWDGQPLDKAALHARLAELGRTAAQTELHLYADQSTRYADLAEIMSVASVAGLGKIAFATVPAPRR
ncbi:MAG: ExbD/TolR family protein [Giesbergeria sp.]|jgi:biopolymer transport protein ExbD